MYVYSEIASSTTSASSNEQILRPVKAVVVNISLWNKSGPCISTAPRQIKRAIVHPFITDFRICWWDVEGVKSGQLVAEFYSFTFFSKMQIDLNV